MEKNKFNVSFTICILILEIVIFLILKEQDSIDQPLPVYLFLFMLLPTVLNVSAVVLEGRLERHFAKDERVLNYIPALTMMFLITVAAAVHFVFSNTLTLFCLPILVTIVFSDIKYKIKGLGIFRVIYYLPNLIAATSIAFLFNTLLDWRFGTFNQIISGIYKIFGARYNPIDWIGSPNTAGYTIAVISAWMWFGNSFIMLMAGVQGISKDYFEAAAIDGAGRWTVFGKITLPLLKPMLMYVAITSLIGGLQMFDLPYLMSSTSGAAYNSVYTAVMYLYKFGFTTGTTQTGYASAIAYVIFLIVLAVSIVQLKVFNRKED